MGDHQLLSILLNAINNATLSQARELNADVDS